MNHRIPDFNLYDDDQLPICSANLSRRIPTADQGDLPELIWQKEPVHCELSRRRSPPRADSAYACGIGAPPAVELFMEDEMATWLHFQIGDDDGGGNMYGSMMDPSSIAGAGDQCQRGRETGGAAPPAIAGEEGQGSGERGKGRMVEVASRESTVEDSGETVAAAGRRAVASSSSGATGERKRKERGGGDLHESKCEDAEFASGGQRKNDHRTTASGRRSRAAEVHNLSERRRRDKINEKMKALQELIPRCNKADKASLLDEAIEYLRALQLQVRMMSMGCNMGPVMLPGVPAYFPTMGMGMAPIGGSLGMNPGLAIGPDPAVPGLNRPIMQFGTVLATAPVTGPSRAMFAPRTLVPTMHSSGMVIPDQFRVQAPGQRELPLRFAEMPGPNMVQVASAADSGQHYLGRHQLQNPDQFQAAAEPDSSQRIDRSDKSKLS